MVLGTGSCRRNLVCRTMARLSRHSKSGSTLPKRPRRNWMNISAISRLRNRIRPPRSRAGQKLSDLSQRIPGSFKKSQERKNHRAIGPKKKLRGAATSQSKKTRLDMLLVPWLGVDFTAGKMHLKI